MLVNNHDMCVQVTDDMKTMTESPPPAKRSRPGNESSRRVTFNPNVQERALHPATDSPKPVTLKEAADIVVRYLDPFYTQGKFATKVSECCVCKKKKKSRFAIKSRMIKILSLFRRSCLSLSLATCLTFLQREGAGGKAKVKGAWEISNLQFALCAGPL